MIDGAHYKVFENLSLRNHLNISWRVYIYANEKFKTALDASLKDTVALGWARTKSKQISLFGRAQLFNNSFSENMEI